ncbi:MAG TPA: LacI family DNA-binding transcriptional regulator [Thiolinea sp.]|nr:LacI family DNA-binding transcriptional regulator [Thiolinea sp.]
MYIEDKGKARQSTLADVALYADVSVATVSRALREPEKVSAKVRARIQQAVEILGYIPNTAARALATSRTDVIGVLVPSVTNIIFAEVLRGIYDTVGQTPYTVQLGNTDYSPLTEERLLRLFLGQRPAGLVISGLDQSPSGLALLRTSQCPVVQIMDVGEEVVDMAVGFSHLDAAADMTRHLVDRGYRRIAFLGARMDPRSQRRLRGYQQVLEKAGLFDERLIVTTPRHSTVSLGGVLLAELFSREPLADAVFCNNDALALGALFESQRRRIRVPEQLGIAGFSGEEMMADTFPSLSTLHTYRYDIGQRAVEMLRVAIESGVRPDAVVDMGYRLIERESTQKSRESN